MVTIRGIVNVIKVLVKPDQFTLATYTVTLSLGQKAACRAIYCTSRYLGVSHTISGCGHLAYGEYSRRYNLEVRINHRQLV